jgi:hypothetical protein
MKAFPWARFAADEIDSDAIAREEPSTEAFRAHEEIGGKSP